MQQQSVTDADIEEADIEQLEPDWVLASYGQRVGAWLLDLVWYIVNLLYSPLSIIGPLFIPESLSFLLGSGTGLPAIATLIFTVVNIGYFMWWLFALGRGQTPGKQIVGIRVIFDNGESCGWGYTFLREFVLKFLLLGLLSITTLGAARVVNYLWPLWDRAKMRQTLHDKLLGTVVVRSR